MKLFLSLIATSSAVSTAVGYYTDDVFNAFSLYSPLAATSWAISEWFNGRKNRKQLLED